MNSLLKKLENPKRQLLGPNYWGIKQTGLLLPKNKIAKTIYIIIHEVGVCFVISQYIELYAIITDVDLVLTNLKISMLSIMCSVKANTFIFWQPHWRKVLNYVTTADQFERDDQDESRRQIINKYTKYCRRVTSFYWVLICITFVTTSTTSLMKYLSSSTFREGFRNGTEMFPHLFSSWMPIDKYHSPGCWITVFWHVYICFYGAVIMATYDSCIVIIMVFFGGKTDLLQARCKQMFSRCGAGINDNDFRDVIRQLHDLHGALVTHSRMFNSLLSPVMFLYVVVCSLMLCASAYQLTSATTTAQKLLMAEYLLFAIAQLFLFCWHSNGALIKNEDLSYGIYASDWLSVNVRQRRDLLILTEQLRTKGIFTAGPFTDLTVSTFITLLKGAYSYYTLVGK